MNDNLRFVTRGLSGLKLPGSEALAGNWKLYSGMWLIVIVLTVFAAGCNGTNEKLGGGSTGPTVGSTVPAAGATGVAVNTTITATFNQVMDPATITETTFTVTTGATVVAGIVALSTSGLTATFTPDVDLTPDTRYTATITTGAKDVNGKALAADKVWIFTTGTGSAPTVISTVPVDGATGVAVNTTITATFSTAMDFLTINATNFTLTTGATTVPGTVTYNSITRVAAFAPSAGVLASETTFIARIKTGVKDVSGNSMASDKVWVFTTGL